MNATLSPMRGISPSLYSLTKDRHNTGNFMPYSFWIVCGFFNVPHELINMKGICETGPTVFNPYPRRFESLTICWCNYKGSTFYSVILRPWVLVQLELNSQPPAWQQNVQPTEPPVPQIETNKDGSCKDRKILLATIYEYAKHIMHKKVGQVLISHDLSLSYNWIHIIIFPENTLWISVCVNF